MEVRQGESVPPNKSPRGNATNVFNAARSTLSCLFLTKETLGLVPSLSLFVQTSNNDAFHVGDTNIVPITQRHTKPSSHSSIVDVCEQGAFHNLGSEMMIHSCSSTIAVSYCGLSRMRPTPCWDRRQVANLPVIPSMRHSCEC